MVSVVHLNEDPIKPNRVVLFGGGGFIGSHLTDVLVNDGIEVICPSQRQLDLSSSTAKTEIRKIVEMGDCVVVLAARTPDRFCSYDNFLKNINIGFNLFEALKDIQIRQLIYFSSDAVYGRNQALISEDSPLSPVDLYGAMHLSRELMISTLLHCPSLILRPTLVYGSNNTHISYGLNKFLASAVRNKEIHLFGEGEEMRDHVCVNDLVGLVKECLYMKTSGILNLATGESVTFRSLADLVCQKLEVQASLRFMQRTQPIWHRHFDVTNRLLAFSQMPFRNVEEGADSILGNISYGRN